MNNTFHRNSFWLLFARLTAQGLAILFVAVVARRLGVADFGQFAVITSLVLIGNTFTNFGTDTFLIREIARAGIVTPIVSSALGLQLVLSLAWWVATLAFRPSSPLLIYSVVLVPLAFFSIATALLRAFERMDLFWSLSLANGLIQLVAALFSTDLWTLCLYLLTGQIILAVLAIWMCSASFPPLNLVPFKDFRPILKLTLPFAALTILLVLSQRLGILSVSLLMDDVSTGLFSSVGRVVDGLKFGHYAILGALLPILSRGPDESRKEFRSGFVLLMGLTLLMAIGLMFFASPIINILYGEKFATAIPLLSLLGWSLLPYTIASFISYDLIARGREQRLVKATLFSLVVFALLYFLLTPLLGLPGATWAALTGECIQAIIFVWFSRRNPFGTKVNVTR